MTSAAKRVKPARVRVVMAASEAVPYAKTGGLGDVVNALPRALKRHGIDIALVVPAYRNTQRRFAPQRTDWTLAVPVSNRVVSAGVLVTELADGIPVYLVEADQYFDREGVYGTASGDYSDNAERFAFFSRAVLALLLRLGAPDVLHCHDWQTGLAPAFLRADHSRYQGLERLRTVYTIHNLGYQGVFWHFDWHLLDLDWRYYTPAFLEFYDHVNYLKAGLVFADALTTVSPTYAQEIQTPAFGYGLDGVLRARRDVLRGILNGVDYDEWNPETDAAIGAHYSARDLKGKASCKADLQHAVGLPRAPRIPVLGVVSRLAEQKGVDLIAAIAPTLLAQPLQLVVLGTGDARYQRQLHELARSAPQRFAVRTTFDDSLAHKIEAGSDIFLMPSRYEPCGLNQMYSLRYGTIPVVHATGGLEDTIIEFDALTRHGDGFKFRDYTNAGFLAAIDRALDFYARPREWSTIIRNAMAADFSWQRAAEAYVALYDTLIR